MVYRPIGNGHRDPSLVQQQQTISARLKGKTPTRKETYNGGCVMFQSEGTSEALPESVTNILQAAWRPSTHTKYQNSAKKWQMFCKQRKIDPYNASLNQVLIFLSHFFEKGHAFKTIVGYVTVIKKHIIFNNRDQMAIKQFLKGVFNLRPPIKKFMATWDVTIVLNYLSQMKTDTFFKMSKKLATIYMILAGTRVNTLFNLKITNLYLTDEECAFTFDKVLKHTRPNFNTDPIVYRAYPYDKSLCPVQNTKDYLTYRLNISSDLGLFTTSTKPHNAASDATIARWVKETLSEAGINTGKFGAHSCRSAATSAADFAGIEMSTIAKAAGWSGTSTFYNHYKKDVMFFRKEQNFGYSLLQRTRNT